MLVTMRLNKYQEFLKTPKSYSSIISVHYPHGPVLFFASINSNRNGCSFIRRCNGVQKSRITFPLENRLLDLRVCADRNSVTDGNVLGKHVPSADVTAG